MWYLIMIVTFVMGIYLKNYSRERKDFTPRVKSINSIKKNESETHNSIPDEKNDLKLKLFKQIIEQVNYFSGEIRYTDLVYLLNIVLSQKGYSQIEETNRLLRELVTTLGYKKLKLVLDSQENHWSYDEYSKELLILSILPNPVIGSYFDNSMKYSNKKYLEQNYMEARIRNSLWRNNSIAVIQSVAKYDFIQDDLHLQQNEDLIYIGDGYLYENRVTHHRVSYNGFSGNIKGVHAGSYDYDTQSSSNIILTIYGTLYLTTKRIIIIGENYITEQNQTKVISLGSILSFHQEGHRIHISRHSGDVYLAVSRNNIDQSSELDTKLIIHILSDLFNHHKSEPLPSSFSLSKKDGSITYCSNINVIESLKDDESQDKFISLIGKKVSLIFNNYLSYSYSWLPNDEIEGDMRLVPSIDFSVKSVEGSKYFKDLILNQPKEWFLKNLKLIKLQNKLNLFQTPENQKSWSFIINDPNYKNPYELYGRFIQFTKFKNGEQFGPALNNIYKDNDSYRLDDPTEI